MQAKDVPYEVGDLVYRETSDGEKERGEVWTIHTVPGDASEVDYISVIWEEDMAYGDYNPNELTLARKAHRQTPESFPSYEEFEKRYTTKPNFEGQEPV